MKRQKLLGIIGGSHTSAAGRCHVTASQLDNYWSIRAAMFSKNYEKSRRSKDHYGLDHCNTYEAIEDFLNESKNLDAISIVTPTNIHAEQCIDIIKNSNTDIFCEKAIATSSSEAEAIKKALSQKTNQKVYTFFNYTGYPMVRELREMIAMGDLGELVSVEILMPQQTFLLTDAKNQKIRPQEWRLKEQKCIPHVSLDLGAHVINLGEFVTQKKSTLASAYTTSRGNFPQAIDLVNGTILLEQNIPFCFMYGKCMLGHDNGLRLTVNGSKSSVSWNQKIPDILTLSKANGEIYQVNHTCSSLKIANHNRYTRFKSGHPTGFIEAFANYYQDLYHQNKNNIFSLGEAIHGLKVLEAIHESSSKRSIFTEVQA